MPSNAPRRLVIPTAASLYDRLGIEALSCRYGRAEVDAVEREYPGLVIERSGQIMAALRHGAIGLAYAFTGDRAFVEHFPGMLEELLPKARRAYGLDTVHFRLSHGPSRPAVEPVLRNLWFEPRRAWLQFALDRETRLPATPAPRGVSFRAGGLADLDDVVRIDRESFPNSAMPRSSMERILRSGERVLLAQDKRGVVGVALWSWRDEREAYLSMLGVVESQRGRGVGAALTARVAKAAFAEGGGVLELRTDDDNQVAISLYRKLGFRHVATGRDYERPADPKVIAERRRASEGTFIKFGGWR
jgi:ribosomal-protein-alanine N-acetyltransferase